MSSSVAGPTRCARHPKVETGLACGRCETPICPRCMVMTDVGARCPDCAPRRKLPQFEIGPLFLLRGLGAALAAGAGLGLVWGLLVPEGFGFLFILLAIGLGIAIAEAVSMATNRKMGPPLQVAASLGVIVAYVVRSLIWEGTPVPGDDFFGYLTAIVGIVAAVSRLRD